MPRLSKIGAAALAAFGWTTGAAPVPADFLVIAGGGGGGFNAAGGGGAGGYRTSAGTSGGGASAEAKLNLNPTQSYTVTVGAGGAGGLTGSRVGGNGGDSVFSTVTSTGGGGGGASTQYNGNSGGSGGGGYDSGSGGSGTANQGYAGGNGNTGFPYNAGGGGGAGEAGNTDGQSYGGDGVASSITGTSVTRAGGGGGGRGSGSGSNYPGGDGGGGDGGGGPDVIGGTGSVNTGSGGGGGGHNGSNGGQGGSGIVIISYVGAQQFGGGVVTSVGGNTIHTFTTSGTLSPLSSLTANYLIVAGGGGGGTAFGAGGGAGGLRSTVTNTGGGGSLESALRIDTNSIYLVTVGAGGAGAIGSTLANGANGSNSSFLNITSIGGGTGGNNGAAGSTGGSGGAGGNQGSISAAAGAGTANQGFAGGTGSGNSSYGSGGGGGAGAIGGTGTTSVCGAGGAGVTVDITGSSVAYAGGGGGGATSVFGITTPGNGGNGGGGKGADSTNSWVGYSGSTNTGGGGGGGGYTGSWQNAGAGGSGVVIISYPGSTPQMAGGTVTVAGGNVIHTFTSSGYLSPIVNVNNSLRFRSSASAYLNRNAVTPTLGTKCTFSCWHKRGQLGSFAPIFSADKGSSYDEFGFESNDTIYVYTQNGTVGVATSAVFRDPSAWYHIVCAIDTTQATDSNRILMYVNGVQQTLSGTYPAQNYVLSWQVNAIAQFIAKRATASTYRDGYLAEVNFVDGQALTPNSFGSFNGLGVWQPIRYGGSYGTNGFYLPFNAGALGYTGFFNGSNQYLTMSSSSNLTVASNTAFSIEFFMNFTNFNASGPYPAPITFPGGYQFYIASNIMRFYNGSADVVTGAISISGWHHVVVCRNSSGSISMFIDGVRTGNSTVTGAIGQSSGTVYISSYNGTGGFCAGSISNVRFVNGSTVYDPTAYRITVPTSALTAVTNTVLLTCQSSTFVDNSPIANSITNNNSALAGQAYPFAIGMFNDQGPAGNNWTPNNISGQPDTSQDFMTDVPTNTSATVANYCVMNPLTTGSLTTLSGANLNLVQTSGSSVGNSRSSFAMLTGKWYFETTLTANSLGIYPQLGIMTARDGSRPNNDYPQAGYATSSLDPTLSVIYMADGTKQTNGSASAYGSSFTNGDVIGIAIDSDNGAIYFGKQTGGTGSMVWQNSGVPTSGASKTGAALTWTGGTVDHVYSVAGYGNLSQSVNFGQRPFSATPPTGFVALNTFNLPTPTIGATPATTANNYFNAVLYSGNNSTQTITTGFQPDFIWSKCRNVGRSHRLIDSVRGLSYQLFSDSTAGGSTYDATSYVSSITSTSSSGFSITNAGTDQYNTSGENYVSWAWKANGSGSTNTAGSIISTVSSNTTAGFSIVTYTGNGTNSTVGHGLLVGGVATAPSMVIVKSRSTAQRWTVYTAALGNGYYGYLNETFAFDTANASLRWNTAPTSSVFGVGTSVDVNGNTTTYVAYCFAQVAGYSAFGSYTGNGSSDGPFIYTGFRPKYLLIFNITTGTGEWLIQDSVRDPYNYVQYKLAANRFVVENDATYIGTSTQNTFDFLSNGFKARTSNGNSNGSSNTYIYMAFAESPFKYANAR